MSDISFYRESPLSNIILITGESQEGSEWLAENVQADPWQYFGAGSIACEINAAHDIMQRAIEDGLEVE